MDEGKILLFNLSDGLLGEQTSQVLGQLVVAKLQTAVFSRADIGKAERRPFYLYLDEFQTFVGVNAESYQRLLSRSRKYAFGLVLANQQTVQISSDLLQEILRNVSTLLSFNVSHLDATKLHKEFLLSMGEQADHIPTDFLQTLKVGEAWGKIGSTVFPFTTMLADQNPDPIRAKEVIERSRINYGMPAIQPATNGKSHFLKNPVQKPVEEPKIDEPVMNHKQSFPDPSKVF